MKNEIQFDWVIRNGMIVDGTGNPRFRADIGIRSGLIVEIGSLINREFKSEVEAKGKIVCPGFIDAHSHSDSIITKDPINFPKISQGITTEILGQDGISFLPISNKIEDLVENLWHGINGHNLLRGQIHSFEEMLKKMDRRTAQNFAYLIPHSTIRMEVMGISRKAATKRDMSRMVDLIRQMMLDGAIGLSTGLTYWPECYTPTEELITLCSEVALFDGIYVTHLRDYNAGIFTAIEEAITIGERAGIAVHISHLSYDDERIIKLIDQAREKGVDVTFDLYPYLAGNTLLVQFLPDFVYGDSLDETIHNLDEPQVRTRLREYARSFEISWDGLIFSNVSLLGGPQIDGLTIIQAAEILDHDPIDLICNVLVITKVAASVIEFSSDRTEAGLMRLMKHSSQMFCTDAIMIGSHLHPRSYGSFPRVLGRYVRQSGTLTLEEAIRKMTSLPAQRHCLSNRGLIKQGIFADIVIFDPDKIIDEADYEVGDRFSKGIEYLWVNGELVLNQAGPTGLLPGHSLPRHG